MKFSPGQHVIVLDTTHRPVGFAIVENSHPGTDHCTVLFQYPGRTAPESIPVPQHRLILQHSQATV